MFNSVRDGVVRIRNLTCDGEGTGSGFLVEGGLIATVAHVVKDSSALVVRGDHGTWRAEIVGMDLDREIALVRPINKLNGHQFELAREAAYETQPLNALGYPHGQPLAIQDGKVSSLEQQIRVDGNAIDSVMMFNADITSGMSGGPVVDEWGRVVGLVEASKVTRVTTEDGETSVLVGEPGMNYAVPMDSVSDELRRWSKNPEKTPLADCGDVYDIVRVTSIHADAPFIARLLDYYYWAVSNSEYHEAASLLSPAMLSSVGGSEGFAASREGVVYVDANLKEISFVTPTSDDVLVDVTTRYEDLFGDATCTRTELELTMSLASGFWEIANERRLRSSTEVTCP